MKNQSLVIIICLLLLAVFYSCTNSSEYEKITTTISQNFESEDSISERKDIITCTIQILDIEAKRNGLNEYISLRVGSQSDTGLPGYEWFINQYFLNGYSQDNVELEGMTSLKRKLLFLNCPQAMQVIKDTMNEIYSSEVELAERQLDGEHYFSEPPFGPPIPHFIKSMLVLPEINQYNIELWLERYDSNSEFLMNHPWVELQLLRKDVYTHWAEILREHGIDPAQEGFTELLS